MTHRFRNIPFTNTLSLFSKIIKSFSNIVKVILWHSKTVGAVFFIAAQCKGSYWKGIYSLQEDHNLTTLPKASNPASIMKILSDPMEFPEAPYNSNTTYCNCK
ncbi:hypothetical protein CEXT_220721 [Caerostris extrusa]|uniref:Uncharacterized protein n=1 Tax=Caerostris extrusa TaxID=172846 RepID=A0AAV4N1U9_CAEEX|nr:hypothetical protein CEXT_220721 [Caerostris extrusa]